MNTTDTDKVMEYLDHLPPERNTGWGNYPIDTYKTRELIANAIKIFDGNIGVLLTDALTELDATVRRHDRNVTKYAPTEPDLKLFEARDGMSKLLEYAAKVQVHPITERLREEAITRTAYDVQAVVKTVITTVWLPLLADDWATNHDHIYLADETSEEESLKDKRSRREKRELFRTFHNELYTYHTGESWDGMFINTPVTVFPARYELTPEQFQALRNTRLPNFGVDPDTFDLAAARVAINTGATPRLWTGSIPEFQDEIRRLLINS